jgi:1-acyl-sn-glycerol-3-phosphate acyltransferase
MISVADARAYVDRMIRNCEPLDGVQFEAMPLEDEHPPADLLGQVGAGFMGVTGWRTMGGPIHDTKAVIIAAPHTTNWDLPYTLGIAWHTGLRVNWLGKHTLFQGPTGVAMKGLGGLAVDRRDRNNMVGQIAQLFEGRDRLLLVVPPEGTRGKTGRWKTGFYWIAHKAQVPILMAFVDYEQKLGGIVGRLMPSGDIHKDFEIIRRFYSGVKGLYPDLQGAVTLAEEAGGSAG